ncbi:MAG: endonuclease V [Methanotrichaceae archaeon]|nr:endonuclease V [Methanotrichaceae archaeon]
MRVRFFHPWNVTYLQAISIQIRLRHELIERPLGSVERIAAVDASFVEGRAYAVAAAFSYSSMELLDQSMAKCDLDFPYIPGLLTFREGSALLMALDGLAEEVDVILFDGQGQAHPRFMGEAAHLGILLDKPSIGCAKSWLWGEYEEPGWEKGSSSPLIAGCRQVGAAVRTRSGVKPIFVSPGHLCDNASAKEVALGCCRGFRIPEPLRFVHAQSKRYALEDR